MTEFHERLLIVLLMVQIFLLGVSAQTLREDEGHFFIFLKSVLPNYPSVFNSSSPPCEWDSSKIFCIGQGPRQRIFRLTLSGLGLNGSIPNNSLGALSALSVLDISNNFLTGDIPADFFKLLDLTRLNLANNRFTGAVPPAVGDLQQLLHLDLSQNRLGGPLPGSLGTLKGLKYLDLHDNNFSGPMLKLIDSAYINYLDLSSNRFTGCVPPETFRNRELLYLNLSRNFLTGEMPKEANYMTRIQYVDFSLNDFEGAIPDFSNLSQLRMFDVSSNRLNGSLPWNLTTVQQLQSLSVAHNKLTGSLPPLPWGRSSDSIMLLDCRNNSLTGNIPEGLLAASDLTNLRLANNKFTGPIPSNVTRKLQELDLGNNRFTGEIPETLTRLQSLTKLDVSSNYLNGSISWDFINSSTLEYLNLAGNQFEGNLPNFSLLEGLVYLNLSSSNFNGTIPDSVGELKMLAQLDLSHNYFTGNIPTNLSQATNLTSLDLSYNNLSGKIPLELISLTYLNRLNLSFNNLSGEVPYSNQWSTFSKSSFEGNPLLCGIVVDRICPGLFPFPAPAPVPITKTRASSSGLKDGAIVGIALGSAVALFLCASLCTFALFHDHRFTRVPTNDTISPIDGVMFESNPSAWAAQVPHPASIPVIMFEKPLLNLTFANLIQTTNSFHKDSKISDGRYGPTFKGVLTGGLQIVVKILHDGGLGNELEKAALLEALGKIRHENLVSLLGYCIVRGEMLLVSEYMENGNVYQCLQDPDDEMNNPGHRTGETWVDAPEKFAVSEDLSWPIRHRIAVGVARALAFLHHGCSPNIIHRDVTSTNIMLDSQFVPRLADCGLASLLEPSGYDTPVMGGTVGYVPPEYGQTCKATPRGDVYSFGVVLLELVTGKTPTGHDFQESSGGNLVGWVRFLVKEQCGFKCLDPKLLATGVESEMLEMLRIGYLCTAEFPTKRPTMQQVVGLLKDIHVEVTYL